MPTAGLWNDGERARRSGAPLPPSSRRSAARAPAISPVRPTTMRSAPVSAASARSLRPAGRSRPALAPRADALQQSRSRTQPRFRRGRDRRPCRARRPSDQQRQVAAERDVGRGLRRPRAAGDASTPASTRCDHMRPARGTSSTLHGASGRDLADHLADQEPGEKAPLAASPRTIRSAWRRCASATISRNGSSPRRTRTSRSTPAAAAAPRSCVSVADASFDRATSPGRPTSYSALLAIGSTRPAGLRGAAPGRMRHARRRRRTPCARWRAGCSMRRSSRALNVPRSTLPMPRAAHVDFQRGRSRRRSGHRVARRGG